MTIKNSARSFAKKVIKASKKKKAKPAAPKRKPAEKPEEKIDPVVFLRNRVAGLEHELRVSEKARQEEVNINKQRIQELYSELDHLRQRVYGIKTKREQKVEELERRIRERAQATDIHKILEMERQLRDMQSKYEQLKLSKKYSPASLEVVKMAIESLKQKINEKKRQVAHGIPSGARHVIRFEPPSAKKGIPAEEISPKLPKLPSLKEMKPVPMEEGVIPPVPPELVRKPKRTFKQKLRIFFLGKPKPRFK